MVLSALEAAGAEETAKGERLAARRALQRAGVKAAAARRRRDLQRRFLYTQPLVPRAGAPVRVFYNPDATVLRGRPDVFMRGSFNRWDHPQCFLPIRMAPAVPEAGGLGFLVAEIEVPADAHVLDLCFLDSPDTHGGFYDTNRGLDYHVEVAGGSAAAPPLRVAHVAAEMAPIAKAGGLGDVVTALGRAVQEAGHEVEIVMPKYDCIDYAAVSGLVQVQDFFVGGLQVKVWRGTVEGLTTTFLEPCNGLFWVGSIYTDMVADRHRFGVFCDCAREYLLRHAPAPPYVVHAHDWQSAPVLSGDRGGAAAAFTIHNLNFGADLIAVGMAAADVATTVSPTYADEIGGHPAIAPHHSKFYGIRNGIDADIWDPAADALLPAGYTAEDAGAGKAAAKAALRARMGLAEGDVPLVGCVTRLTHQKGIHLIKHAAWRAMERGAQFVLLGSAPEPAIQAEFDALAADLGRQYPDRARLWFAYDEPLSHLIYAGSDLFLVPSMFEPCGLTQMVAMRYGAVPVVRRTGGLADTVFDLDDDEERAAAQGLAVNGFSFDGADTEGMDYALNRALGAYFGDKEAWGALVARVMGMDWSWSAPAQDYIELYHRALKK
jgi:starch synthase